MNKQLGSRISWIDVLKGIGIILVVIGHVYNNSVSFKWLYSFHMPLFFFAAGWVYNQKPIFENIKRRIDTIVIPYFSLGFLGWIYWAIIERRFRDSTMGLLASLVGFFRGQYDYLDFNVHLWFLPCFFLTAIYYNILTTINKKMLFVIVGLMSIIYIIAPLPQLPWGIDRVFKYVGFWAFGDILSNIDSIHKVCEYRIKAILGLILIVLNYILCYYFEDEGIMWFIIGSVGILGMVLIAMWIDGLRLGEVLRYLGRISLVILCFHGPVYRIIVKIVSLMIHSSTDEVRMSFILVLIVVCSTLFICATVYEIINKCIPWMIGRRKTDF